MADHFTNEFYRHAGSTDCLRFSFVGGKRKKSRKLRSPACPRIWTEHEVQTNRSKTMLTGGPTKTEYGRRGAKI